MQFVTPLVGQLHQGGRLFRLSQPFIAETSVVPGSKYATFPFAYQLLGSVSNPSGVRIEIPAGFVTDFASVPTVLWSVIGPIGKIAYPAVVHDYLYTEHENGRKWADAVLYEGCRSQGMGRIRSFLVWAAVRIAGRSHYRTRTGPLNDSGWRP